MRLEGFPSAHHEPRPRLPNTIVRCHHGRLRTLASSSMLPDLVSWRIATGPFGAPWYRRSQAGARPPAALMYGTMITVPEPIPDASTIPDEPPLRSEQIDLTLAIKRCRTWQELRRLYWANRTRQGVINVVSYFTRLAALLPDLPRLLSEEEYDNDEQYGNHMAVPTTAGGGTGVVEGGVASAAAGAGARGGRGGGRGADTGRGHLAVQQQRQQQKASSQSAASRSSRGGTMPPSPPRQPRSLTERAALRQLVLRLVYDACSFTEEHVAAGRLEEVLRNPAGPWDTSAYAAYLAEAEAAAAAARRAKMASFGSSSGGDVGRGGKGPAAAAEAGGRQQAETAGSGASEPAPQRPLSFWDWVRDRPETWVDPIATAVTGGLRHWDESAGNGSGAELTAVTPAAAVAAAARRRRVPLCYGPQELTTLVWAAARLQLHRAVPEHAAWLVYDMLHASYRQLPEFDARQLAQLGYSLGQLGPCVPPGRWRRRFLEATRRRMVDMGPQSLANLVHSLEPLRLVPDPDWLRRLMLVSGPMLEGGQMSAAELTQLGWAVFSLRRRICRVGRWAAEILSIAGTAAEYGTDPAVHLRASAAAVAYPLPPMPSLLDFLPSLLSDIGCPLPPQRLEELRQLVTLPPPLPPTPPPEKYEQQAGRGRRGSGDGRTSRLGYAASALPGSATRLNVVGSGMSQAEGEDAAVNANPWVNDRAAALLLAAVSVGGSGGDSGGGNPRHGRLAAWLLEQPPSVYVLTRLWADGTRAARQSLREAEAEASTGHGGNACEHAVDCEPANALLANLTTPLEQVLETVAAFQPSTFVARCLDGARDGATRTRGSATSAAVAAAAATTTPGPGRPPATSLAAAVGAAVAGAAYLAPQPQAAGPGSLTTCASSTPLLAAAAASPLLRMLHTHCWPSDRWLAALAAAASARLHSQGFRSQSLGMLLWSLAGLGYSPPPGWLQPWLQRAEQLVAAGDFRAANLVSVLCALSAWAELPAGRLAAALRAAALRLLPAMGARELQLTASALAQLCELPPPAPPQGLPHRIVSPGRTGGRSGRGGGRSSGGDESSSGGGGGSLGLFMPLAVEPAGLPRGGGGGGGRSREGGQAAAGSATGAATTASTRRFNNRDDENYEDEDELVDGAPAPSLRAPPPLHRRLEPRVGKLLVQRAVQVSYSYSPRHMAHMLRLLTLRLACLKGQEDLWALLYGHAVHLEAAAAAAAAAAVGGRRRAPSSAAEAASLHYTAGSDDDDWDGVRQAQMTRRRELRELGGAALDAARAVVAAGQGGGGGDAAAEAAAVMSDYEAAALLPPRWWRAYLAALDAA